MVIGIYIFLVLVGLLEPLEASLLHRQAIKRQCPQATPLLTRFESLSVFFCEASNPQPFTNGKFDSATPSEAKRNAHSEFIQIPMNSVFRF